MPQRLRLPIVQRVEFRRFSLYSNRPSQEVPVRPGVFCVAGGNGLGKSTFLNAVAYGLTGVVPNPRDRFDSVSESYRHNLDYAARYFRGRIDDADYDAAEISVSFRVGAHQYQLTRGLFEVHALRQLDIRDDHSTSLVQDNVTSNEDRDNCYRVQLTADLGLGSFDQFVFLQNFVLTFDERRQLLFWDNVILEQALYLAFGITPEDAERADKLRRQADRADSQARNLQYQATTARGRLRELQNAAKEQADAEEATGADYDALVHERDRAKERAREAQLTLDDARLELTRLRAEELSLRTAYEREFAGRFHELAAPDAHPVVTATFEHDRCAVCGTAGEKVVATIQQALDEHRCPLCDSPTDVSPKTDDNSQALTRMRQLGAEIESTLADVRTKEEAVARLLAEASAAHDEAVAATERMRTFETEHDVAPDLIAALGSGLQAAELRLRSEIEDAIERKDSWRRKRDQYRGELRKLQGNLAAMYREAEMSFVPLFTGLAQDFLGLDLELQLDVKQSTEVELVLSVEGTRRRLFDQLSESQRYFVDIALRMALTLHMTDEAVPGTLFIDTPEGSLDLAYEARAGAMFATYVERGAGNNLIMTANLNASQLLHQLARRCGRERMELVRMIDWSNLSDVQADAEDMFESAYSEIEADLDQARAPS